MIKRLYSSIFSDMRRASPFISLALFIFFIGIGIGMKFPGAYTSLIESFTQMAVSYSRQGTPILVLIIFFRNSLAALIAIGLGPFLGLVPSFGALANGILIGMFISLLDGPEKIRAVLSLVPHGLFELPAIILAWGLGIWRAAWYFQKRRHEESARERGRKSYRAYFALIIPLLFVAAVIEGICIKIDCFS